MSERHDEGSVWCEPNCPTHHPPQAAAPEWAQALAREVRASHPQFSLLLAMAHDEASSRIAAAFDAQAGKLREEREQWRSSAYEQGLKLRQAEERAAKAEAALARVVTALRNLRSLDISEVDAAIAAADALVCDGSEAGLGCDCGQPHPPAAAADAPVKQTERMTDEELAKLERFLAVEMGPGPAFDKASSLVAEVRAARELLAKLEWSQEVLGCNGYCPVCGEHGLLKPHQPGCKLAAALGR